MTNERFTTTCMWKGGLKQKEKSDGNHMSTEEQEDDLNY